MQEETNHSSGFFSDAPHENGNESGKKIATCIAGAVVAAGLALAARKAYEKHAEKKKREEREKAYYALVRHIADRIEHEKRNGPPPDGKRVFLILCGRSRYSKRTGKIVWRLDGENVNDFGPRKYCIRYLFVPAESKYEAEKELETLFEEQNKYDPNWFFRPRVFFMGDIDSSEGSEEMASRIAVTPIINTSVLLDFYYPYNKIL